MVEVYLMKIAPYNPFQKGLSKFESLKLLTMQQSDSQIGLSFEDSILRNLNKEIFSGVDLIISSNLRRAKETVNFLIDKGIVKKNVLVKYNNLLNEIKFDLSTFCSEDEYEKYESDIVRKKFIENFIKDSLIESQKDLKKKFEEFSNLIGVESKKYTKILCISHTFFIKLYSIYKKHKDLFDNPKIINKSIDPNKKIMNFCEVMRVE